MSRRLFALGLGLLVVGQVPAIQMPVSAQAAAIDGLRAMRMAMSQYVSTKASNGAYGTVADAVKGQQGWKVVSAETAAFVDYDLTITKSQDGKRFQASLTSAAKCAPSWFSSEVGVIHTGKPIGCN